MKTRISFASLIFGLVLLGATGCAHRALKDTAQQGAVSNSGEPFQIIDVHTHTVFTEHGTRGKIKMKPQKRDDYFKEMKDAGVVGAIAHTLGDDAYENLQKYNVIHCAGAVDGFPYSKIEAGLKSKKYSCIKIYLGYYYRYANDRQYDPLYKMAAKYDVPVVFHTGDTLSKTAKVKYADPLPIDEVAVDNPKVRFVIAHCGNPWIESAAEVAYKNDNVYLEGSALLTGDMSELSPESVENYVVKPIRWIYGYIENPKKIMFGTDWPLSKVKPYADAFKRAIPKEHWKAVFHDNALEVFKALKPNGLEKRP